METTTQPINQTSPGSTKMLVAMVGIGVMCALLIVLVYEGTFSRIENLKAEALQEAIFKVLPGTEKTKAFQLTEDGNFTTEIKKDSKGQLVYAGYSADDQLTGVAISASGQGYADIISILYGYDLKTETVVGFYVLETKETPGLGDKIEKEPHFLANFEALDVSLTDDKSAVKNKVITVKQGEKQNAWEVDGITGATISSRAIGSILGESTSELLPKIFQNKEVFELNK